MQQICALARGDSNQTQVNQALVQEGIDVNKLPVNGSPLSLLVNGDTAQSNTLCSAYLVKTVLLAPILSDFMSFPVSAEKHPESTKPAPKIDPARLIRALAVKLAVAKASADIFALIALELQHTSGLTVGQYCQRTQQLFALLAAGYLKHVRKLYAPEGTKYILTGFLAQRFAFISSSGCAFEYSRGGVILKLNNIIW